MTLMSISKKNLGRVLDLAVQRLIKGDIVAFPTETFYGLGVRFDNEDSLKRLYKIKKRPEVKALPLIIGHQELLSMLVKSKNKQALSLIKHFWPGPLTILLQAKDGLSNYITAKTGKVAVRIPGESFALKLARIANFPITATSANISGMPPARDAKTVIKYFGDNIDLLIDGGLSPNKLPSTIVDVTGKKAKILREGIINKHDVLMSLQHLP